jgi:hypothetical protein
LVFSVSCGGVPIRAMSTHRLPAPRSGTTRKRACRCRRMKLSWFPFFLCRFVPPNGASLCAAAGRARWARTLQSAPIGHACGPHQIPRTVRTSAPPSLSCVLYFLSDILDVLGLPPHAPCGAKKSLDRLVYLSSDSVQLYSTVCPSALHPA